MNNAWSLTVSEVSGPGVELSCLGAASINDETGADSVEIRGNTVDTDASVVANAVVGTLPSTGVMLSGKMLERMRLLKQ